MKTIAEITEMAKEIIYDCQNTWCNDGTWSGLVKTEELKKTKILSTYKTLIYAIDHEEIDYSGCDEHDYYDFEDLLSEASHYVRSHYPEEFDEIQDRR